jgi:glycosyltransferase involved in cell wall biosynthesis
VYWPQDLPLPAAKLPWRSLPPLLHPFFQPAAAQPASTGSSLPALPDTYILYHGPLDPGSLATLAACWSWAAPPLGEYYPLVIYGVEPAGQAAVTRVFQQAGLVESVRLLPPAAPAELAQLYRGCSALLQPAPASPWGCPLRHALVCGRPVVAASSRWAEALAGPAAFLAPPGEARQLGAALISVIVEEELSERLSAAAQARAAGWAPEAYWQAVLADLYSTPAG